MKYLAKLAPAASMAVAFGVLLAAVGDDDGKRDADEYSFSTSSYSTPNTANRPVP